MKTHHTNQMRLSIICAIDKAGAFGFKGDLPWRFPEELKWFRSVTMGHHVLMGRRTWESLPSFAKPLKGRTNIVLTSRGDLALPEGVAKISSLDQLQTLDSLEKDSQVFIIGGKSLVEGALLNPSLKSIYLTCVDGTFEADIFLPTLIPYLTMHDARVLREGSFVNRKDDKVYNLSQLFISL